uniref:Uncharacterized protein n=1 Tax=Acrobeloides nanus TaxID=290746 RepID=A0A914E365_9BILA
MPLNAIECSFINKQEDLGRFKEILDNYLRQKRIVMIEDGRRSEDKKDILATKYNIAVEYKGIVHREKFKLNILIKKVVDKDKPQSIAYEVLVKIDEITD